MYGRHDFGQIATWLPKPVASHCRQSGPVGSNGLHRTARIAHLAWADDAKSNGHDMADYRQGHRIPDQKLHISCLHVFGNLEHLLVGLRVVPAEAQQLWDRQAPGVGRHEECKAPMAQTWNEAIFPKLSPAHGFSIIPDRRRGHDVLLLGHCNQQASPTWLLDVVCDQATPPCMLEVFWYLLQFGVLFEFPPLLQVLPLLHHSLRAFLEPPHGLTPLARCLCFLGTAFFGALRAFADMESATSVH